MRYLLFLLSALFLFSCHSPNQSNPDNAVDLKPKTMREVATPEEEKQIRLLIEQLIFKEGRASNKPVYSPGISNDSDEYAARFKRCREAFDKLTDFGPLAVPFLVEHLSDRRHSIQFRNHYLDNSVGQACYWNLYYQFMSRPRNYSSYGYMRKGKDGKNYPKPYWEGSPFGESGDVAQWLKDNQHLSYLEKKIKATSWLLNEEKKIGAPDPQSYFLNILPLEVHILEIRLENGEDVKDELEYRKKVLAEKIVSEIPKELLP